MANDKHLGQGTHLRNLREYPAILGAYVYFNEAHSVEVYSESHLHKEAKALRMEEAKHFPPIRMPDSCDRQKKRDTANFVRVTRAVQNEFNIKAAGHISNLREGLKLQRRDRAEFADYGHIPPTEETNSKRGRRRT